MNVEDLAIVQQNVPQEIGTDQIRACYEDCGRDLVKTICKLLELPPIVEKPKTDWEMRRDIADSYDVEMQKMMRQNQMGGSASAVAAASVPLATNIVHKPGAIQLNPILE